MVIGILRSKGFFLPRHRVRDFIGDHDPVSVLLHWTQATVLRKYSVAGPNSLWHIDGLHKLIRWGFVVHGSMWISSIMCYLYATSQFFDCVQKSQSNETICRSLSAFIYRATSTFSEPRSECTREGNPYLRVALMKLSRIVAALLSIDLVVAPSCFEICCCKADVHLSRSCYPPGRNCGLVYNFVLQAFPF